MPSSLNSKHTLDLENSEKRSVHILAQDAQYDDGYVRKTLRHVDWRLLPLLGLVYAVALIDRTNLGIASTAGMDQDLGIYTGNRYNIASAIYFPSYILLQIPGNIILRILGARTWLTICVIGWGAAQLGMAFVPNWGLLCACRVILGAFEAGFFPALAYIITTWYKRHEVQKRLAIFYLTSTVIGGFSSILAFAITKLAGKANLNGWQWIFLILGVTTIFLGILTWFFVVDFPEKNTFLKPEQTQMILDRVQGDRGDSTPDKLTWRKVVKHLSDPFLWSYALMFMASTTPAYALGFFITIILNGMGFSEEMSLLLTAPPYLAAAISCFFFAWIADKTRKRAIFLVIQNLMTITGLMLTAYTTVQGTRYFGLFLVTMGSTGCIPAVLAYNANNVVSHTKRAVSTAVIIAAGGIGGIFATTVYRDQDFPLYLNGIWATMGCQFLMLLLLAINTIVFTRRNRQARKGEIMIQGTPGFLYTI